MVQIYVVVTKLGEVSFKLFILLQSASMELAKIALSANIGSSSVQTGLHCVPQYLRISYTLNDAPYFGGTGKSPYKCSLGFLSHPIIVVFIIEEIKRLW